MAAGAAAMLLGACEGPTDQTLESATSTPKMRRVDAATQEKIKTLREQLEHHLNTDPSATPTPTPR
jgi:hypothetical protein